MAKEINVKLDEDKSTSTSDVYIAELTNIDDYFILNSANRQFTLHVSGITVDKAIFKASCGDGTQFAEIFESDGITQPLTSNGVFYGHDPYYLIKIEKSGGTDTIKFIFNFVNHRDDN